MKRPDSIVMFDFDGVLADSLDSFCAAMEAAFAGIGRPDLATREQVLSLLDDNWFASLARAGVTAAEARRLEDLFAAALSPPALVRCFPGVPAMLERLARRHLLVVITSSTAAIVNNFLATHQLAGIEQVMGAEVDTSKVRKIERVVAAHGRAACYWYVGDTTGDILEGRKAGARTIGVTWGWHGARRLRAVSPDHLVDTPLELAEIIDG
jgi:phosphoglycolate phosphatase